MRLASAFRRGSHRRSIGNRIVCGVLLGLAAAGALQARAAGAPRPVSPGARTAGAVAELRCPTFSWAGIAGAAGYELAVFRLDATADAEPVLVTRASVAGDARAWTPGGRECLERGERYAWSVAAVGARSLDAGAEAALDWAPALLFEVEAAPSREELERALTSLERRLDSPVTRDAARPRTRAARSDEGGGALPGSATASVPRRRVAALRGAAVGGVEPGTPRGQRFRAAEGQTPGHDGGEHSGPRRAAESPARLASAATDRPIRVASADATPVLGDASLRVSGDVALGAASNVFKDGEVFLWDDTDANTALGRSALASNTTGTENTASGTHALRDNTTGYLNTAVGVDALESNTLGAVNTAIGAYALGNNTTGYSNTASGIDAMYYNTVGYLNTANGSGALYSNTAGYLNTAVGVYALGGNDDGYLNTAIGGYALASNSIGYKNSASGVYALAGNADGNWNTASGYAALLYNTTGNDNTATGAYALAANGGGQGNTAAGWSALAFSTGTQNIAVGYRAGYYNTTGNNSIFIGNTGTPPPEIVGIVPPGDDSTIKIGTQDVQTTTFVAGIYGASAVDGIPVYVTPTGQLVTSTAMESSRTVKRDIQELGVLSDRLLELRPVAFRYRRSVAADPETPLEFGLIAEEVAEVFPELVFFDPEGKPSAVKYHLLSSLLLGELQQQHDELEELRARLMAVESRP